MPNSVEDSIRILHVDDDSSMLHISKQMLTEIDNNFKIDFAYSVDEAFEKLSNGNHYDIVVSDHEMPQKNGLEFLTELREKQPKTPFILFTGKGREEVAIKALNKGADGYYNKIGDPEVVYGELAHGIKKTVEKTRIRNAFEESERRYHTILDNSIDAIIVHDLTGKIVDVNQQAIINLGYPKEELLQMMASEIDGDASTTNKIGAYSWARVLAGETITFQSKHRRKDKTVFPVEVSLRKLKIDHKDLILASIRDNTERIRAEERLRLTESLYNLIANNTHDVIWTMDLEGHFTYVSPSVFQLRGYTPEEVIKQSITEALTPASAQIVLEGLQKYFTTGYIPSLKLFELEQPCKDGSTVWTEVNLSIIKDKDGEPTSILGVSRDITERRKVEKMTVSDQKFFKTFKQSPVAISISLLSNGLLTDVNDAYLETFEFRREEVIGKTSTELGIFLNSDERQNLIHKVKTSGKVCNLEVLFKTKSGKEITTILSIDRFIANNEEYLISSVLDVSERKKTEEKVQESEMRFQSLFENSLDAIAMTAPHERRIIMANSAFCNLFGMNEEDIKKIQTTDLLANKDQGEQDFKRRLIQEKATGELLLQRKDGSTFIGEVSTKTFKDAKGSVKATAIIRDVTNRMMLERQLRESHDELKNAIEKLQVIGHLTRHDVRNKHSIIKSNTYLLKKKASNNTELLKFINSIELATNDSEKLFDFGSMYEKIGAEELCFIDTSKSFDDALKLNSEARKLTVVNDCQGLKVKADSLLNRLFYNLIDNSLKHGQIVSEIRLSCRQEEKDTKLIYGDNGVGIKPDNKGKVFSKGFSTGNGSGLGLYLIKKIIDAYGWTISENGEEGKGARFEITIPNSSVMN